MIRRLAFLGGLLAALTLGGTSAYAAPVNYPAPAPRLVVSAGVVTVGESVTITGSGFPRNATVFIAVAYGGGGGGGGAEPATTLGVRRGFVGSTSTDHRGRFTASVRLKRVGTAWITASATGVTEFVSVRVIPPGVSPGDKNGAMSDAALPVTGTQGPHPGLVLGMGATALVLGAVLVWLARIWRRRTS